MKYLVRFEDVRALNPEAVGQKFFNLARAARAGFAVPRAVVIDTEAHRYYITHGCWPKGLLEEVTQAATDLDLSAGLSIRSSATLEDLEDQSFAGQYRTFLGVIRASELKAKIEQCWNSAGSPAIRSYLKARQIRPAQGQIPLMGVMLQKMVKAFAAGVAFGRNPMYPARDEIVIEAVKGLADALVSGCLTPYRAVFDGQNQLTLTPPAHDLSCRTDDEAALMNRLPWSDIADLVRALQAKNNNIPLDIEWAIDEEKRIWLLQSRAITTLDQKGWQVPAGVWTRKIANDLWADRLTPFLADAMVQTAHRFDLSRALKILGIRATRPTLAVINGYLYVNCRSIENLLAHIPAKLHLPDLKVLFPADFAFDGKSAPSIIRQISAALRIPALVFLEPGIIPFFCVWITRRNQKIIHKRLDHLQQQPAGSARQAFNNLQLLLAVLSRLQISNQWPYFFASYLTWLLRWLMVDCFGYTHDNFLEVLGKKGHNTTIKIEKRFRHLANQIAIDADFQAQFISQPPEKLLPALPSYFREELNAFLSEFGCRSRHRTLVVKRWAEAPEEVVGILQALVRHLNETQAAARSRAPSASIPRQKSKRPFLLGPLIRLTRKFLDLREEQRFLLDQVLYQMRLALLAVGRHSGLNEKIMFLKQAEIRQLVDGDLSGKKGAQIAAERQSRFLKPFDVSTFYVDGRPEDEFQMKGKILRGVGTSPGSVCGRARIVKDPARVNLNCGEILVAENTDPGWTPILSLVKGMVIEEGGLLNHCSIVARELGIPAVVGVRQAVRIIPEGAMITIDGGRGLVSIEED